MRSLPGVLLAFLVVLAGCSGLVDSAESGPRTVNPALRQTPTSSPVPTPTPDYPPGIDADHVDFWALSAAHHAALEDTSVTVYAVRTVVAANGTPLASARTRTASDGSELRYTYVSRGPRAGIGPYVAFDLAYWLNDTRTVVRRVDPDGNVTYQYVEGPPPLVVDTDPTGHGVIRRVLSEVNATPAGTVRRKGRTLTVLRASPATLDRLGWPHVSNVSFVAYVTDEGVVRSYTLRYETVYDGVAMVVTRRFRIANVGTTIVERPAWYDDARRAANASA